MHCTVSRCSQNPLITPADVVPSHSDMEIIGTFNPGAIVDAATGETVLLIRVAERFKQTDENVIGIPVASLDGSLSRVVLQRNAAEFDFKDSRVVCDRQGKIVYLTSLSHIRLARSGDGVNFSIETAPFLFPCGPHETWGIEDPRIVWMQEEQVYVITYTAVSPYGAATALATTRDFKTVTRCGVAFPPENKDVCVFPQRVKGLFCAYHRPVPRSFGNPDIWSATSPDLSSWGNHRHVLGTNVDTSSWDCGRVGGGAPSVKCHLGWLHIYHAADVRHRYCLGAFVAHLDDPSRIIARSRVPILEPDEEYERVGYFGNVVFTCGVVLRGDDSIDIYYGAADDKVALCNIKLGDIEKTLIQVK